MLVALYLSPSKNTLPTPQPLKFPQMAKVLDRSNKRTVLYAKYSVVVHDRDRIFVTGSWWPRYASPSGAWKRSEGKADPLSPLVSMTDGVFGIARL